MTTRKLSATLLQPELALSASRSSGPGGQHVNKVNSKITLKFDVPNSLVLTDEEKSVLLTKLASRLSTEGVLILTSQDKRSQLQNKEAVMTKLDVLLAKAFEKRKARKATRPSKGSVQQRMKKKKEHSEKKQWRKKLS
ncbi:MAG TPA: alternative ribosome rescue aminoacyl-tRNA hydrolase ArfB [Cyclobacteriaceae bacterium]|nr:alternative ribosome rescue aminoacyl-tRNA hydrolase ArfB [Cyclobacteriaceae bacterium]